MTVENLGSVIPESDYLNLLVPLDFCVTRIYWSTKTPYQRCVYTCSIIKVDTRPAAAKEPLAISDTTICHDPLVIDKYTPPEMLSKKYPSVFDPETFGEYTQTGFLVLLGN